MKSKVSFLIGLISFAIVSVLILSFSTKNEPVQDFIAEHHKAVLSTFRKNGMAQLSVVVVGNFEDGAAFTTTENRSKLRNLRRDHADAAAHQVTTLVARHALIHPLRMLVA